MAFSKLLLLAELWLIPVHDIESPIFSADEKDQEITDFISAVNDHFKSCLRLVDTMCIGGSMVKSYHKNLKGKMKKNPNLLPLGNEFKTVCDNRLKNRLAPRI